MAANVSRVFFGLLVLVISTRPAAAEAAPAKVDAHALLKSAVYHWMDLAEPPAGTPARKVALKFKIVKAEGLPPEAEGVAVDVAYQYPDYLRASATIDGEENVVGRDGQLLWTHQPAKKFALLGKAGVLRFKADPASVDSTVLPPFSLPISRLKIKAFMLMVRSENLGQEAIDGTDCQVIKATLSPAAVKMIGGREVSVRFWIRRADLMPMRIIATDGRASVQVDTTAASIDAAPAADFWQLKPNAADKVETVALSHLTKLLEVGPALADQKIPTLGPVTGSREVVARSGAGRLEIRDGTRVLFLKGSPEEMGKQHGELLRPEIRDVTAKILYGIGVGSSFAKGSWFFGDVENAQARITPFIDPRVLREMDALADAAGMSRQEARLANFFPELFHCSGFALLGKSSQDGHVYHGRVLDYLKGVGLEQNAVVIVTQPDDGRHAWVNLGYAGLAGSVTAMNEKGISIGEMGGNGAGDWDGKPMAQLVREVMERAGTLDEAIAIMKAGPRTCEYYYVITDGKTKQAVGIGATPKTFVIVHPGEANSRLPHPVQDTVLLSAGDRYETLSQRVKDNWGKFNADSAKELMSRPVCMTSNIQSVLFVPDTLDFYVANADAKNVASATRYTQYNLKELLHPEQR